ncbi:MAG: DUF4019 domain-containing protein [Deltaproteobacteria bacterium]|nr:DUF4019 domain-containing protein [Deltaproteobacteria bacterium]
MIHLRAVTSSLIAATLALAVQACASSPAPAPETAASQTTPSGPPPKLGPEEMKQARLNAQVVAGTWLLLVDKGELITSWDTAARRLQDFVPAGDWKAGLEKARGPFGEMQRRHFVKTKYTNKLQPPGHYVVVSYHSQFAKSPAKESVTVVREADNQWRVVMYGIEKTDTPPPAEEAPTEPQNEAVEATEPGATEAPAP